ncbi:MAG: hypothetical protein V4795_15730 [Pseudomonadota bacterium]
MQAISCSNVAFCGQLDVWLMNTFASVLLGAGNMLVPSLTFLLVSLAQVVIGGAFGLGRGRFLGSTCPAWLLGGSSPSAQGPSFSSCIGAAAGPRSERRSCLGGPNSGSKPAYCTPG